jgi:hypothetical protein
LQFGKSTISCIQIVNADSPLSLIVDLVTISDVDPYLSIFIAQRGHSLKRYHFTLDINQIKLISDLDLPSLLNLDFLSSSGTLLALTE